MKRGDLIRRSQICLLLSTLLLIACQPGAFQMPDVAAIDRDRILSAAHEYLDEKPLTITAYKAQRSAGGIHDFYSEGDYWWPNPDDPDGPYIRRDGMSNPDKFDQHRQVLLRLSIQVPALTAAYMLTGEKRFALHAIEHLRAWFISESTRMNPSLEYAQAIQGRCTGRGVGIIDTIHLIEVAQSVKLLANSSAVNAREIEKVKSWFAQYLDWMTTHRYGIDERERENNHGTCWVMQVAAFAHLTANDSLLIFCRERFKQVLVPDQIAPDGRFPLELERTKPYSYSLFNLDALAMCCQLLSTQDDNLWLYQTPEGQGMRVAMEFMFPYIQDRSRWPYPPDVMYFDRFPVRHPSLLLAGIAYEQPAYIHLWKQLSPDPTTPEVIRNFPIRQPVLWLNEND